MLERILQLTRRLPKSIDPDTHAAIDYLAISSFLVVAGLDWDSNKRAAVAALISGGFVLSYAMFTDYSGSLRRAISFPTHGKLDIIAGTLALIAPTAMGFSGTKAAKFFRGTALNVAGAVALTDWYRDRAVAVRRAA